MVKYYIIFVISVVALLAGHYNDSSFEVVDKPLRLTDATSAPTSLETLTAQVSYQTKPIRALGQKNVSLLRESIEADKVKVSVVDGYYGLSRDHKNLLQQCISHGSSGEILDARKVIASASQSREMNREYDIQVFFQQHPVLPTFDIVSTKCTRMVCEVQAFGYSANSPYDEWAELIGKMHSETWWNDFVSDSTVSLEDNGRLTLITYLLRRR